MRHLRACIWSRVCRTVDLDERGGNGIHARGWDCALSARVVKTFPGKRGSEEKRWGEYVRSAIAGRHDDKNVVTRVSLAGDDAPSSPANTAQLRSTARISLRAVHFSLCFELKYGRPADLLHLRLQASNNQGKQPMTVSSPTPMQVASLASCTYILVSSHALGFENDGAELDSGDQPLCVAAARSVDDGRRLPPSSL